MDRNSYTASIQGIFSQGTRWISHWKVQTQWESKPRKVKGFQSWISKVMVKAYQVPTAHCSKHLQQS